MSGPVSIPTCLAIARGFMRKRTSAPGPASEGMIPGFIPRALLASTSPGQFDPVTAIGQDRERLRVYNIPPDAPCKIKAIAAAPEVGLIVIRSAQPGPCDSNNWLACGCLPLNDYHEGSFLL